LLIGEQIGKDGKDGKDGGAIEKGAGTEGTYSRNFLIATQTIWYSVYVYQKHGYCKKFH